MTFSRRTFMGWLVIAAASTTIRKARAQDAPEAPETLSSQAVLGIRKLAEVYGGVPLDTDTTFTTTRYEQYFEHRARKYPRIRQSLEARFQRLEEQARACHQRGFHECAPKECLRLVAQCFPASGAARDCGGAEAGVSAAFIREVQRPILLVYLRTHAWTDMGYAAWPGTPRGLEAYRQPPAGAAR